ncbi:MAG: fimbrillin family protein [Parabacteroides sp.]|nr:fimbrillin family protein [Parabacteroides sp.]
MRQLSEILIALGSLLLYACTAEDYPQPAGGETVEVRFTATTGFAATKTPNGSEGLAPAAKVAVHAWKSNKPSGSTAPAYSTNYKVKINSGTDDELEAETPMNLQTGVPFFFYALSTNDAVQAVPVLKEGAHTVSLRNGVDYLMAVADNNGSGYTFNTEAQTIPLSFRHLATRVELTVSAAQENGYTAASGLSVGIAAIDSTGSYIDLSATFASGSAPSSMIFWPFSGTDTIKGGIPLSQTDGQRKEAQTSSPGTTPNTFTVSFILLPVSSPTQGIPLQLDFSGLSFEENGANPVDKKSYTAQIMATGNKALTLKGGYTYKYEIKIARYSATFGVPKVIPWEVQGMDVDHMEEVTINE